jgi:hypothetical protein
VSFSLRSFNFFSFFILLVPSFLPLRPSFLSFLPLYPSFLFFVYFFRPIYLSLFPIFLPSSISYCLHLLRFSVSTRRQQHRKSN